MARSQVATHWLVDPDLAALAQQLGFSIGYTTFVVHTVCQRTGQRLALLLSRLAHNGPAGRRQQ